MKKFNISFVFILFSLFIASDEEIIRNSLEKILPAGSEIESIQESSIPGLYSVYYGDLEPIYVTKDGNFFIYGDIYKINIDSISNITDLEISKRRSIILSNLKSSELISFKSNSESPITWPSFFIKVTLEFDAIPSSFAKRSAVLISLNLVKLPTDVTNKFAFFSSSFKVCCLKALFRSLSATTYVIAILIDSSTNTMKKIRDLIPI